MREVILAPSCAGYRRYTTALWSTDYVVRPRAPYYGRGWAIGLRRYEHDGPDLLDAQERLAERIGFWPPSTVGGQFDNGAGSWISAAELLIYAPRWDAAQRAANLLFAAMLLIDGQSLVHERVIALPEDEAERAELSRHEMYREVDFSCQSNLTVAAALAATLSRKKRWQYAGFKHWISHRICSVPWIELEPKHGQHFGTGADRANHVTFAQAIIAAYSIIEELGFEIRASKDRPSTTGGQWNPDVLQDLEHRLQQGGIDLGDYQVWLLRGPPRRLDQGSLWKIGPKTSWSSGPVRDVLLPVTEAIRRASWLRSRVSSHRLSSLASSLTVYDVVNVQMLGRRLVLDTTRSSRTQRR